jgi:phage virion morphogenesis protein
VSDQTLQALEQWAGALLQKLSPAQRRQLNQSIARDLRRSQQQRIAAQQNPDGTAFVPRKKQKQLRNKRGRIRTQMFAKLRTAKYLKLQSDANSIAIGFVDRTARIARVHQFGMSDRPSKNANEMRYPQRELLGFAPGDIDMIGDRLLAHLVE